MYLYLNQIQIYQQCGRSGLHRGQHMGLHIRMIHKAVNQELHPLHLSMQTNKPKLFMCLNYSFVLLF